MDLNGFREDGRDLVRALLLVIEPVVEFAQFLLLGPDEQLAQLIQVDERFSRRWAHPRPPPL